MRNGRSFAGLIAAGLLAAVSAAPAWAADQLLPAGKCPFSLGVPASMRTTFDPFGGMDRAQMRYRAIEEKGGAIRVSVSQNTGRNRVSYSVRCSSADPAKWLSRFGGDEATVCKAVNRFPDDERKSNAYCSLKVDGATRVLLTGTTAKDGKEAGLTRGQARFTAASAGVGMISGRVYTTSADAGQARALAEQLVATLKTAGDGAAKP